MGARGLVLSGGQLSTPDQPADTVANRETRNAGTEQRYRGVLVLTWRIVAITAVVARECGREKGERGSQRDGRKTQVLHRPPPRRSERIDTENASCPWRDFDLRSGIEQHGPPPRQGCQPVSNHLALALFLYKAVESSPRRLAFAQKSWTKVAAVVRPLSLSKMAISDDDKLAVEDWVRAKLIERSMDGQRWHIIATAAAIAVVALILFVLLHGVGVVIAKREFRDADPVGSIPTGAGDRAFRTPPGDRNGP
jgi:hypothetical protein